MAASCEVCGFVWDSVAPSDVPARVNAAVEAVVDVLRAAGAGAARRPSPTRWSTLEYSGHLRDVLLVQRERIITASVLDTPTGAAMYRDDRVDLGFYRLDTLEEVAAELAVAAGLFAKSFELLPEGYEQRELIYSALSPERVSIAWVGAQAVHECEHHLGDVRENAALL